MLYTRFKLYEYKYASTHSKVLNVNQLNSTTFVEIPHEICKILSLYNIQEITTGVAEDVKFIGLAKRECLKPWIEFPTSMLNWSPGFHMYKFSFMNTTLNTDVALYIAYIAQCDNPDKPYIYMGSDRTKDSSMCASCINFSKCCNVEAKQE